MEYIDKKLYYYSEKCINYSKINNINNSRTNLIITNFIKNANLKRKNCRRKNVMFLIVIKYINIQS